MRAFGFRDQGTGFKRVFAATVPISSSTATAVSDNPRRSDLPHHECHVDDDAGDEG